jgi:signal transduction histidine kinase
LKTGQAQLIGVHGSRLLAICLLVAGLTAIGAFSAFKQLTGANAMLAGGAIVIGILIVALERLGQAHLTGLATAYGLSIAVVAARFLLSYPDEVWRISILVAPLIGLATLSTSIDDGWRIGLLNTVALWFDFTLRSLHVGGLDPMLLADGAAITIIYVMCCGIAHGGRYAFDTLVTQISTSKRIIAERNVLLERQARERDLIETQQAEQAKDMRGMLVAADELLTCATVDDIWRKAIEIAQSRLGIERCGIFVLNDDRTRLTGTWGVDSFGAIRDEKHISFDATGAHWAQLFSSPNPDHPVWLLEDAAQPDAEGNSGHRHWVVVTAIRARSGAWLGVMYNDTMISQRPFSSAKQDMLAVYCSLVAGIIGQKQLELEVREQASTTAALGERSRLARELHDSVSQSLFGIVLGSRTAIQFNQTNEANKPLDYVLSLAETALYDIRALIFELQPESLAQEGLVPSLQKQLNTLMARHHIAFKLHASAEPPLTMAMREAVYRVLMEAAQNTIKHAQASRVTVTLGMSDDQLTMWAEIRDDGKGFDTSAQFEGHYGLINMRERMLRLNGTFTLASAPGSGTRIRIEAPAVTQPATV